MPSYKTFQGIELIQALAKPTIPVIKGWNRLEGRPRTKEFDETLRAEVRDALWMVTRQWQMGEFNADDAGSPIMAKVKIRSSRIKKLQLKNHPVEEYDESLPLETRIEQETLTLNLDLSLQIGHYWSRLLQDAFSKSELSKDYRNDFKVAYKIELPATEQEQEKIYPHQSVWQWYAATANRSIHGALILQTIIDHGDILDKLSSTPTAADASKLNELKDLLWAWWQRQYAQPQHGEDAWSASHLEYQANLSAPQFNGDDEIVLTADEYHQGHLDWYSFDVSSETNSLSEENESDSLESLVSDFIPTTIEFGGMPNARWWEFEDRKTYFGGINADTTDLSKLLLIEFGLIYANDWFLLPFEVPVGSLSQVEGLAVTNVFGERTWIEAAEAHQSNSWDSWSMYRCNTRGISLPSERFVFIPPVVDKLLQGNAIEKVNFIRDEMANMVWGIEQRMQLPSGEVFNGYELSNERLNYLLQQLPPPEEETAANNDAKIKYVLMNSVPENWIPFIPVHIPDNSGDENRKIQLQRAAMLRTLDGSQETPKIRPLGSILGVNLEGTYFVHEEEVPRAGAIVTRNYQRTRWHDGKVCVWLGRKKITGRGEGSSGLAFDQIKPVENSEG
jgi:hypothetical protein